MRTSTARWPLLIAAILAVIAGASIWQYRGRAAAATSATFTVSPGGTHAVGESFSVTVTLSDVTFDATSPSWFGYDFELDYDPAVLNATAVAPTLCPTPNWASTALTPAVVTGCFLTAGSTAVGVLETITVTCVGNGTSPLHLPAHHAGSTGSGNGLFDGNATDFPMTLNDGTVVCGTGVNDPTATPTPIPPTPTPTATPTFVGKGTFSVADVGTHAVGDSFAVTVNLSDVVFGRASSWAGYEEKLEYDPSVLQVASVAPTLCATTDWALISTTPYVLTGCNFESNTATSGVLETITVTCAANGTSQLHLPVGPTNILFDRYGASFDLTLSDGSVICGTGIKDPSPTAPPPPTATATRTATPTGGPGFATFTMRAPAAAQPLGMPFMVTSNLTAFTPGSSSAWAGYNFDLSYDPSIIAVTYAAPTLCPRSHWGNPSLSPEALTGCFALQTTATGVLDTFVVTCLSNGTSALHMVDQGPWASNLFNSGAVSFSMTLQDASVTCDQHADDDRDGCASSAEASLGLDPMDGWDFYSVPSPSLLAAPAPRLVFKDNVVSANDAQAVFAYFKAGAKIGTAVYDQDLNGNGIKDGVEYDRRVVGPAASGMPDGAVSSQDAQLAFAQFKRMYRC